MLLESISLRPRVHKCLESHKRASYRQSFYLNRSLLLQTYRLGALFRTLMVSSVYLQPVRIPLLVCAWTPYLPIFPQHTASCCQSFQGAVSSRYRPSVVGRLIYARRLPLTSTQKPVVFALPGRWRLRILLYKIWYLNYVSALAEIQFVDVDKQEYYFLCLYYYL